MTEIHPKSGNVYATHDCDNSAFERLHILRKNYHLYRIIIKRMQILRKTKILRPTIFFTSFLFLFSFFIIFISKIPLNYLKASKQTKKKKKKM